MSILGAGLMGALDVGRSYLQNDIRAEAEAAKADQIAQRQEATDVRRDDMSQKRAIAIEQLKELFARSQSEEKYTRLQNESEAIDGEVLNKKAGLINAIRRSVPNDGEFSGEKITDDHLQQIRRNMSPEDAKKYYNLDPETSLSKVDDQIAAARKVGAFESRPALIEQRKQLADTDKADRKERADKEEFSRKTTKDENDVRLKENELKRKEANDANNLRIKEIREDTRLTQSEKAGKAEKVMTFIDGQRKEIASESAEINKQMTADLKNAFGPEEKAQVKAEYKPRLNALAEKRDQLDKDFKEIRSTFNLSPVGGSTPSNNSLGAPIGKTPDGRNVYMKDGKKVVGK